MKKVLLIEDDQKLSLALQMRLKMMQFEIASAVDAVRAMDEVNRHRPDLIILDINLPGGSGFIVADRLRRNPESMATPIIFITASERPEFREQAKSIPNCNFLQKPFDASQLAIAVEASLDRDVAYQL